MKGVVLARAERQARRERAARLEAERIAEGGLRKLYLSQARMALLKRIAIAANAGSSADTALRSAVTEVCAEMGWAFGSVYRGDPETGGLVAADIWFAAEPDELYAFVEDSRSRRFAAGQGLPGRVLTHVRPHWVPDVTKDANFPRIALARDAGLRAAFAFPVMIGDEVAAVLEFFTHEVIEPNSDLLDITAQIGALLGRVIERERAQQALIHDALHDGMTGLPNRTLFNDRAAMAFERARKQPGAMIAILMIDLDSFKLVNDTFGHAVGDEFLVHIAGRISACLTGLAAVAEAASQLWPIVTLARMGGDEFTILLDGISDAAVATHVADAVRSALGEPFIHQTNELRPSASIGVALLDSDAADVGQLIRDADLAMYEAKARGRDRTVLFDAELGERTRSRRRLEQDLRRAIEHRDFVLEFQPVVSLVDKAELMGFEALLRWDHPERGRLYPDSFIDVAEETGLILFIGDWVLREACRIMAGWHRRWPTEPKPSISINISPRQFQQPNFADRVESVLMGCDLDPARIRLEVTETVAMQDPVRSAAILGRLRARGVKISLDDFGTGYSSLSYLKKLPFDLLKIDRSFVCELGQDGDTDGIVRAILDIARSMGKTVIAEGIETTDQSRRLREMGCKFAQGYLFGRPLPINRVDAMIDELGEAV